MTKNTLSFSTPEVFTKQYVSSFLRNIEPVFSLEGKMIPNVFFRTIGTRQVDILGAMLTWKFMEYSIKKNCFYNPMGDYNHSDNVITKQLKEMKFWSQGKDIIRDGQSFNSNPYTPPYAGSIEKNYWFYTPIRLNSLSPNFGYNNPDDKIICSFYNNDPTICHCILQSISEISTNFQRHAEIDTDSLIFAKGDRDHFEIVCVDNGIGIVKSLSSKYKNMSSHDTLKSSIEKGVSSKPGDGHMGMGLWVIEQFVICTNGELLLFSNDAYLKVRNGKIKAGQCPHWKGTIIYMDIPLKNIKEIHKITRKKIVNRELLRKKI